MRQTSWMKRSIAAACLACGAFAGSACADPVTLSFTGIDDIGPYPSSWTESGFIITSLVPASGHLHTALDTLVLHDGFGSSPYQIRRIDGGSFDLIGFDFAGADSAFISNTGASFLIPGNQPWTTFTMPLAFQNVSYVNWYMSSVEPSGLVDYHWAYLDNVVTNVSPVPEPAQAALLGLGLAGLLLHRRRAQRA